MKNYIIKRILMLIPVVIGVAVFVFTIMYIAPGDAATVIAGESATAEELNRIRENLGLNRPFIVQLGSYLRNVFLRFDFGKSYITDASVTAELFERFPRTLVLAVASILVSILVGIPLGVRAAVKQNSLADYGSMTVALLGTSMPGFWLALLLVLVFSYGLRWFPARGLGGIQYWILPVLSNAFHGVATQARQARSAMLEVIHSDYLVMARSKGLKEKTVIYKHALPNALIPVITVAGTSFGNSLGGGLVIETVFAIPGVGYYLVKGVNNRDINVVMGGTILLAIAFSVIMLLTDLIMAAVDPRIKSQFARGGSKKRKSESGGKL